MRRLVDRVLGEEHAEATRRAVPALAGSRLSANLTIRYMPPFLRSIARGMHTTIGTVGLALSCGELAGLSAPSIGRAVDRRSRRHAMALGMSLLSITSLLAAASPSVGFLALAAFCIMSARIVYDTAMGAWVADRVPYRLRGRYIGLIEISWAGSMLVGVPVAGLLVAAFNWRVPFVALAILNAVWALALLRGLPGDELHQTVREQHKPRVPRPRSALAAYAGFGAMQCAAICLLVIYGAWLQDSFGFSPAAIGVVGVLLGFAELSATRGAVRVTDRWGKRRTVAIGTVAIVPVALAIGAFGDRAAGLAIVTLALFVLGFEFAIVSAVPLLAAVQPETPGASLGSAIVWATLGRAIGTLGGSFLYSHYGVRPVAWAAACVALAASTCFAFLVSEPSQADVTLVSSAAPEEATREQL